MRPLGLIVCLLLGIAMPVLAQANDSKGVDVDDVWQTIANEPRNDDAMRAQILRVLDHPLTKDVAKSYRLDLDAAVRAVPVLEGAELQDLQQRAAVVETALAGGDSIVISTTVIIIALLVLVIILVAAD